MKKLSLLGLLLATSLTANAQFSITPKVGVGFSNISFKGVEGEDLVKRKASPGIIAGVAANYAVTDAFSLQGELLYNQKGVKTELTLDILGTKVESKVTTKINYLELPILARYSFGSESFKAYLNAGPSFSFGLGGSQKDQDGETSKVKFGTEPENPADDEIYVNNRFDLGLQGGGGVLVKAGPGYVNLDLRYGYGLSNLWNAKDTDPATGKNRQFAVTLGYQLPLGGK